MSWQVKWFIFGVEISYCSVVHFDSCIKLVMTMVQTDILSWIVPVFSKCLEQWLNCIFYIMFSFALFRFFDFSKTVAKRAFRVIQVLIFSGFLDLNNGMHDSSVWHPSYKLSLMIQDTHNVRSVSFHPSGDFVLAGKVFLTFTNFYY